MTHEHPVPDARRLRPLVIPLIMLVLVAIACAPPPDTAAVSVEPSETENPVQPGPPPPELPKVVLSDGFEITLELAMTPEELAQGLMFRPQLPDNRGMLLVFNEERYPSIWMMNTLVALDLVYLDSTGTVVDIITGAQPCPGEPCPRFTPKHPTKAVLEIPAGTATRHEIAEGATLDFARVPEFPSSD